MKEMDKSLRNGQIEGHGNGPTQLEVEKTGVEMPQALGIEKTEGQQETPRKKRRYFTLEYKKRILKEADLCRGKAGSVGALLRREGVYSSTLTEWRKQRDEGGLSALSKKRGRKLKKTVDAIEAERWKKISSHWQGKYQQALTIIEAQKKISEILGVKQVDTSHLEEFDK